MSSASSPDKARLCEIIEHGNRILTWLDAKTENEFLEDPMLRDAVSMNLLVIGEAANALSDNLKALSGVGFWNDVRGLRNRLAHGYGSIDWSRIWIIAKQDAPLLTKVAEQIRAQLD